MEQRGLRAPSRKLPIGKNERGVRDTLRSSRASEIGAAGLFECAASLFERTGDVPGTLVGFEDTQPLLQLQATGRDTLPLGIDRFCEASDGAERDEKKGANRRGDRPTQGCSTDR